ncbi:MAG: GNAT family N-acetyltransferase [Rhodospirillaceae bacterium]|jgi:RimJ/RimL family protein N-acetyltransferase|nr:GNAT family N-acetyltransferase [Rhodospirillaceae bacterium]MBT4487522.1 GNAT family N-acetyltransferase [Rhodospirillaceae bacterium]MBT5895753.1 GNAT family N-acetyltransferase [Rhodospirillaceae bacterium]MBT6429824.1 GNAT family N-acetyltransferase [Rhodospirillaceae bacterium]MBT7759452.1 GNAT family N-acetyltransferase [Rhodospirillaceae bacterium]
MNIGEPVATLPDGRRPARAAMRGRSVIVEPIDPARHGDDLYTAACGPEGDHTNEMWTYLSNDPFVDQSAFQTWLAPQSESEDPLVFAIVDKATGTARGMASFMRITPQWATCEVGAIWFAPSLKRSPMASEAMYLMARHVFEDLNYRRYEWKCDSLNEPSRRAALRFGFSYEGLFRQHVVYKGRNRDTTWYAMIDQDWPQVKAAFEAWLAEENFDEDGRQLRGLAEIRESIKPM